VDVFLQRSFWDEEVEASKDDARSQWTGGEETIEEQHASNPSGGDEWAEGKQADEPGIGEEWSQETPVSDSGEGSEWFEQDGSEAKSASPGSAVSSHPIFVIPSIIFYLRRTPSGSTSSFSPWWDSRSAPSRVLHATPI
jgi:hypothetical protein